jgi:DNA repair exonuclease SbcCD ATPase subunit
MSTTNERLNKQAVNLIQDITDSKGLNKDLLVTRNIKANTNLAIKTLDRLKYDVYRNLIYIAIGGFFGFLPTIVSEDKTTTEEILLNKLISSKNEFQIQNKTYLLQMHSEITSLRKEIDSLKGR